MKAPKVIIHNDAPEPLAEIVRDRHPDLDVMTCDTFEGLAPLIADTGAEVVFGIRFHPGPYPREAVVESDHVRWLSVGGSGTDHLGGWDPSRVTVTNSAGSAADMMAEYTVGAMLAFSLDWRRFQRAQERREWLSGATVKPIEGATLLIVGMGQTGQATARRAKAMGMRVLGIRARPQQTPHVDEVHGTDALIPLLPQADYVLVCVPRLPATLGLMNAAAFAAMKPGAVLIDVSRGGVCDEAALIQALRNGPMAGAALDVFVEEPLPKENPLWDMPNVILTPHCSSVYDGWARRSVEMFAENLHRYRRGEKLHNVVDPARGY